MKTIRLLAGCLLICLSFGSHAAMITLVPSAGVVNLGDSFTVDVQVSDIDTQGGEELALFDLDLMFDDPIFALQNIAFGSALGGPLDSDQDSFGPLNAFENSFLFDDELWALQDGTFSILTLSFSADAVTAGSVISVIVNSFGFLDFDGNEIDVSVQGTTVSVVEPSTPIPEAATWSLLLMGLPLLARKLKK